jgi:signal transduction histidine kinase
MKKARFKVSENCYSLLGIKTGSVIKLSTLLGRCQKKEDQERIEKGFLSLSSDGEEFAADFKITGSSKDTGESKNLHLACMVSKGGEFPVIRGYLQDITSKKKLEKELYKAKNKAEKADRFKTVFLSNLSHEIRNPMNAIMGFAELLNQTAPDISLTHEYTSIIKNKGQYLMTLIDDVIELSRFEAGAISMSMTEVDLFGLMKELHKEFSERIQRKGKTNLALEIEVDKEDRELRIHTDPGRLHQVLFNLISNAVKFTERGRVLFGYRLSNKNVKFFVEDTGIGLSEEDQHRILNRFEEIENTSVRKLEGTGLSLTISRHIVESLGGKLKVKSELGKGSVFQVNIPVQHPVKRTGRIDKEAHLP